MKIDYTSFDVLDRKQGRAGLQAGPLGSGGGAAAFVAALGGANGELFGFCGSFVAVVGFAYAAGVSRSRSRRQRQRENIPDEREQDEQSGGQALHCLPE